MINEGNKNVLIVAVITSFITTFMGSALNVSIPSIESELNVSTASVGWIINSYMLTCAVLAVPCGILGDIVSKKRILITGLFVFSISSILAVVSRGFVLLIIARAIQGIGTAMIYGTNIAILIQNSKKEEKGRNLGIAAGANYFGLSAGPVLGGYIEYYFGWKGIFVISALFSTLALIIAAKKIPKNVPDKSKPRYDIRNLIKNRTYITSNIATLVNFGVTFASSYMLSLYLQDTKGFESKEAGLILVTTPIIQSSISLVVGKISDKFSPSKLSAWGMTLCSISIFILAFINEETKITQIVILLALIGLGSGLFSAPNTNAVMSAVDKNYYGLASSVLSAMRSLGHTTSTSIIMAVGDIKISFIIFGIASIAGIFMALYHKS